MTLTKAIEIKEIYLKGDETVDLYELREADRLSLEAMKRCKLVAEGYQYWHERPLPGETED